MNILDENLKAIETAGLWNLHLLTETLHLQKDGTQRPVSKLSQNPGHELKHLTIFCLFQHSGTWTGGY